MILGLVIGIIAVQLWGLRMSGVITVPLLSIYALYNYATLPVFILSVLAAYLAVGYAKYRSFIYGRSMLLLAVIVGALVPITTLVLARYIYGSTFITEVEFVGTILPGIAAYNFHQLSGKERINDAILSLAILTGLTLLGVLLLRPLAPLQAMSGLPPILHSYDADIATVQNVALRAEAYESVVPLVPGGIVIALGLAITEFARSRWGFRADGMIGTPLLAVFALQNVDVILLYLLIIPITYLLVDRIEAQTGLYGRISLAIALVISLLFAVLFTPALEIDVGLIAFFAGLFAGIAVYNFRRVPTTNRFDSIVITAGLFVFSFALLRIVATPTSRGLLQSVHPIHVGIGGLILIAALWVSYRQEAHRPNISQHDI